MTILLKADLAGSGTTQKAKVQMTIKRAILVLTQGVCVIGIVGEQRGQAPPTRRTKTWVGNTDILSVLLAGLVFNQPPSDTSKVYVNGRLM